MSPTHRPDARVRAVRVTTERIEVETDDEVILDVCLDGRRVWSFWVFRDGTPDPDAGCQTIAWPTALDRHLDGTTEVSVVAHVAGTELFREELRFGTGEGRVQVVDAEGKPLGIDKSGRLAQTFDTRSAEHVAPLLDAVEEVLAALGRAGVEAFPAYGTLLGAVREGRLIGHDSDADLGYVSHHTHPVDVVRESFRLQRALADDGYVISRYSGAAFKVDVREGDGSVRGLDVFGGFLLDGHLCLMGEIRTPFRREWIFPLGTTTLEGRTLPAPADTDRFLTATYGPSWRVPDPAYQFETPETTHRRLNGWFRGTRVHRAEWDRTWSGPRLGEPDTTPSDFARWVWERESARGEPPAHVLDVGCGRGVDAFWYAGQGAHAVGLDFVPRAARYLAARAEAEGLPADYRSFNLLELRSVLGEGARAARLPGRRVVTARHVAEATDGVGRRNLWRFADMASRGGGDLYLEVLVRRGAGESRRRDHLRPLPLDLVVAEVEARGGRVLHREILTAPSEDGSPQAGPDASPRVRRIGRMVVTWER
ncbi:MAG: class I SAM-dependent methyltransferase [Nocardioides sp.]|nr:class I SAM-dependent methyltransferase [Nocardioides sp.]